MKERCQSKTLVVIFFQTLIIFVDNSIFRIRNNSFKKKGDELKQLIEETITTILLSRAEPTPEILIFNLTDEILVKNNLYPIDPSIISKIFSELKKSEKFLLDSFNKWWFQNHIQQIDDKIPLTERIKHLLKSQINSSKNFNKKSLSEIYNIVYKKFNSILTPTKNQITSILTEISPE